MKKRRKIELEGWMAGLTFLALIMLVVIQVSWIVRAARLEEQNFNHRVCTVLCDIGDEIGKKASNNNEIKNYICGKECQSKVRLNNESVIDSIVKSTLKRNNIELDYTYSIGDSLAIQKNRGLFRSKSYLQKIVGFSDNQEVGIRLMFPGRDKFLLAQLKGWFVVSLLFIFFVAISFFITFRMFMRERSVARRTTDFINNMVHEFKTPIANIILATNLIRKKKNGDDQRSDDYTAIILNESRKMERNVEDILKVSGIGHQKFEKTEVDLHEVIRQEVDYLKYSLEEKKGQIILQLEAEKHQIKGDPSHFSMLLSNLIDNAIKYNVDQPLIKISTRNEKTDLVIRVEDNGIGIGRNDLSMIFQKYYRVHTGDLHNVKGFGLGLTCVKRVTELYRGSVRVESTVGKGTVFTIILPLMDERSKS